MIKNLKYKIGRRVRNRNRLKLINRIKRMWTFFTCDHRNSCMSWDDGEGWNITVCRKCGRTFMFTDNASHEESSSNAFKRIDRQ